MAMSKPILTEQLSKNGHVPPQYIRPLSDRPTLLHVDPSEPSIPLIDFKGFHGPDRPRIIKEIGLACETDGFFQVKNHGIPKSVIEDMVCVSREFFKMPESERLKNYSDDPAKSTRLSTSFNVKKEKVSNWRDYLRLHCYPLEDFVHEWPSNPPAFKDIVSKYSTSARSVALELLEAISESLGLDKDCIEKALGKQGQHMGINYYPQCPQPELTYGLPGHTDPNALTLLLQDQVAGLQVLRNGRWVAVNPIPDTFVVNIGDQIQVLSNGRYKSVLHRAVVNNKVERISIPTFYCPSQDAVIAPAEELIDEQHPALYRSFTYGEYYESFWDQGLRKENCLELFRAF
ncbi:protein DMR6-LIKE OXYGENASE 2-like protein [Cinnamomum micranthum f. kanehirae]|uniref:Protein DMR6-LIKE OXYGENASE 2-like protein n=1 Tax=Cinnamomum micranthum f. kanehirae TaxID=337451 RepID=A0A3S3MMV3_9MAGN|nr:protein DMR6-LIKE OXYGENASE 2-like protein [Cinnamomum micranthum f. kanehirae]